MCVGVGPRYRTMDKGGQVDTFILDFETAFDTPHHKLLKCRLNDYRIGGKTLKRIDSFLCDRQQRAVINGVKLMIRLGPRFARCPPGRRSSAIVILVVHK